MAGACQHAREQGPSPASSTPENRTPSPAKGCCGRAVLRGVGDEVRRRHAGGEVAGFCDGRDDGGGGTAGDPGRPGGDHAGPERGRALAARRGGRDGGGAGGGGERRVVDLAGG